MFATKVARFAHNLTISKASGSRKVVVLSITGVMVIVLLADVFCNTITGVIVVLLFVSDDREDRLLVSLYFDGAYRVVVPTAVRDKKNSCYLEAVAFAYTAAVPAKGDDFAPDLYRFRREDSHLKERK